VNDLHCHTSASDGALAPAELVARARARAVTTLGVTDHDTMDGVAEAVQAGEREGVRVVSGTEISVRGPSGSMHLLGYFRGPRPEPVATRLAEIAAFRASRNRRIVERLAELGVPVAWEDVERRANGQVGRPHIADALVAAGHVETKQEAFDRYLAAGMPGYVEAGSLTPEEAVRLVRESGGAPVLAHPGTLKLDGERLAGVVGSMVDAGLVGLEVYRPDHDDATRTSYLALCERFGLVPSGGSDFHRPDPAGPDVGDAGAVPLPEATLDRLLPR
jgi:predicted metal-dependent phosphoesterase TrpH